MQIISISIVTISEALPDNSPIDDRLTKLTIWLIEVYCSVP
jgi:hypothetical protein